MSDFFAGVSGARFPEVVMNQGPLPGMGGLPAPLHDTPDGRINYNSSLLGDLSPYAYGEPGFLSSQNAYLNIPHRIQKIVPYLYLPEPDGTGCFQLCHPIDDGDVAFALRLDRNSEFCTGLNNKSAMRSGLGTAIDPMINFVTLNYILAGMQLSTHLQATRQKWDQLLNHLDKKRFDGTGRQQYTYEDIKHVVRNLARPFGVAHGSEKQGGQHEGSMSAATWPVNFVISLILDGKDANVVNVWYNHQIEAGNDLVFRLKPVPIPPNGRYTLNHYGKGLIVRTFGENLLNQVAAAANNNQPISYIWQLVPDVFSLDLEGINLPGLGLPPNFTPVNQAGGNLAGVCWQQEGYWHIARTQVHSKRYGVEDAHYNDMANKLRTGHVDLTFQPTFYAIPYRDPAQQNGPAAAVRHGIMQIPLAPNVLGPVRQFPAGPPNVINFIGERKRDWEQTLRIERGFPDRPDAAGTGGGVLSSAWDATDSLPNSLSKRGRSDLRNSDLRNSDLRNSDLRNSDLRNSDFRTSGTLIPVNHTEMSSDYNPTAYNQGSSQTQSLTQTQSQSLAQNSNQQPNFGQALVQSLFMASGGAAATEDIGTFEASSPLPGRAVSASQAEPMSTPHLFQVPKPGIRTAKRPSGRGKGVLGALLGTDGSVRPEESRML
jgi:hypothetical protein